jgi:hypothetical protein
LQPQLTEGSQYEAFPELIAELAADLQALEQAGHRLARPLQTLVQQP